MAEEKAQTALADTEHSSIDTEMPTKEIETSIDNAASESRHNWFHSLCSILPSFSLRRNPGTPITRLFNGISGYPRILLIGLDAGGKTLLMSKFLSPRSGDLHTVIPTIGISVDFVQSESASFRAYDIGGCRPGFFRLFDRALFREAEAVIFVVDSNDRDRALEAREELMMEGLLDPQGMRKDTPLLILANKQDLPNSRSDEQIKTFFVDSISTSIGDRPCEVFPTSATTGEGVEEAFSWLAQVLGRTMNNQNERAKRVQGPFGTKRPTPEEEIRSIYEDISKYLKNSTKRTA